MGLVLSMHWFGGRFDRLSGIVMGGSLLRALLVGERTRTAGSKGRCVRFIQQIKQIERFPVVLVATRADSQNFFFTGWAW